MRYSHQLSDAARIVVAAVILRSIPCYRVDDAACNFANAKVGVPENECAIGIHSQGSRNVPWFVKFGSRRTSAIAAETGLSISRHYGEGLPAGRVAQDLVCVVVRRIAISIRIETDNPVAAVKQNRLTIDHFVGPSMTLAVIGTDVNHPRVIDANTSDWGEVAAGEVADSAVWSYDIHATSATNRAAKVCHVKATLTVHCQVVWRSTRRDCSDYPGPRRDLAY